MMWHGRHTWEGIEGSERERRRGRKLTTVRVGKRKERRAREEERMDGRRELVANEREGRPIGKWVGGQEKEVMNGEVLEKGEEREGKSVE